MVSEKTHSNEKSSIGVDVRAPAAASTAIRSPSQPLLASFTQSQFNPTITTASQSVSKVQQRLYRHQMECEDSQPDKNSSTGNVPHSKPFASVNTNVNLTRPVQTSSMSTLQDRFVKCRLETDELAEPNPKHGYLGVDFETKSKTSDLSKFNVAELVQGVAKKYNFDVQLPSTGPPVVKQARLSAVLSSAESIGASPMTPSIFGSMQRPKLSMKNVQTLENEQLTVDSDAKVHAWTAQKFVRTMSTNNIVPMPTVKALPYIREVGSVHSQHLFSLNFE